MRIGLVILHADAARGGAERYTLDLAGELVSRGHEVSVVASSFRSQKAPGQAVLIDTTAGRTRTGRYNRFLTGLERELRPGRFDVVHAMLPILRCDVYHPHAGLAAEQMEAGHRVKSGMLAHSVAWLGNRTNLRRRRFAAVERRLLTQDQPPVVLCLSNLIGDVVGRLYPTLPAEKRVSLFNGIDLARFDPVDLAEARAAVRGRFGISEDAIVGLMLAQDFKRKGLAQAVRAMARVEDRRIVLIVGGKPDASKYRQIAKSLGVENRIFFVGRVSEPVALYKAVDFFVLPTRFDPCSLVVLEALAMGVPVISTDKNGACEVMQDGVHGRVLKDPNDMSELASAVEGMGDGVKRGGMSQACLRLRPQLSQQSHVDKLERIYSQIAENQSH